MTICKRCAATGTHYLTCPTLRAPGLCGWLARHGGRFFRVTGIEVRHDVRADG